MYDVININIGKSRANLICVYIKIFIFYKTRVKTLKLNRK